MPSIFCASGYASSRRIPDGKNVLRYRCFRGTCDEEALGPIHFHVQHVPTDYVFCKQSSSVALLQDNITHYFWYSTRLARAIPEYNDLVVFPILVLPLSQIAFGM